MPRQARIGIVVGLVLVTALAFTWFGRPVVVSGPSDRVQQSSLQPPK